jgi:membrane protein DedA with SNARE-associated domain
MEEVFAFLRDLWSTLRHGEFPELGIWSYLLLIILAALEGPLSVLLGAAAAAAGYLRPDWVYFSAVTGNLIGDVAWYLVGYSGKADRISRLGRWIGMHPQHSGRLEHAIRIHAVKLILLAKLSVSLMIPTLVAAGLARVPWRRWFPAVFAIELVWTAVLVWVGYYATGLIARVERGLAVVGILGVLLLISGVVWYVRRLIQRAEALNEASSASKPALPNLLVAPSTKRPPLVPPLKPPPMHFRHEKAPANVLGD